jgi:hypothetical protein
MMTDALHVSPRTVYHRLRFLEQVDVALSALYRQLAQDILADPTVSLVWRQAIADRLNQANHRLEMVTVENEDSY